jgi:hypothetical protein
MDPIRADIDKICEILDRLGTRDSVSIMSPPEPGIPGLQPAESAALWESLRGVVYRFRELEQKVMDQTREAALTKPDARQINTRTPDAHLDTPAGTPPEETQQETTNRTVRLSL